MNNKELIEKCRKRLYESEEEPYQSEWIDMVENLCWALDKTDAELENTKKATNWLQKV